MWTVRVVGDSLRVTFMDRLAPAPRATEQQIRTVSAWGEESQANLVRLRVGIVGAGSVGGMIAEALARTGFEDVLLVDFDVVKTHNLDRLNYATKWDVGRNKVEVLADHLAGTRHGMRASGSQTVAAAVYEEEGYRAALDCDLLFSCVDRPWGRYVLNLIAYSHLIPVIDGGIRARTNRLGKIAAADWRAHTATIGRPCLQCLGQYDPGHVQLERDGLLDDPKYIEGLPRTISLKSRRMSLHSPCPVLPSKCFRCSPWSWTRSAVRIREVSSITSWVDLWTSQLSVNAIRSACSRAWSL